MSTFTVDDETTRLAIATYGSLAAVGRVIRDAQRFDYENRPHMGNWRRVSDEQVLRLLLGARRSGITEEASDAK